ncbi:hypothetical protein [Paracoccus sp. (in: a-proteobacteria)]|uniref:hypothetical protein n=1 Tax=Paracoccus sp. TaxID=267 RepID=UPI003A89D8A1
MASARNRHKPPLSIARPEAARRLAAVGGAQIDLTNIGNHLESIAFALARHVPADDVGRLIELAAGVQSLRLNELQDRG